MHIDAHFIHGGDPVINIDVATLQGRGFYPPDIKDRPARIVVGAADAMFGAFRFDQSHVTFGVKMCVYINGFEFAH
jgi:hypothetical protein